MADTKKNIYQKLQAIQTELKAPKDLYNNFGKYYYRNAESILVAVKPYLESLGLHMTIQDSIEQVGDRYYVKATVKITDNETSESVEVSAYAREAEKKSGMDDSQITGATSSYARKYALNGLFLLDDTKDADSDEYHLQVNKGDKTEDQKIKEMTDELKELYGKTTGKNFDKWVKDCGGVTKDNFMSMKTVLLKQINDAVDKEKKA
jgi:hypothetical protein